MVVRFNHPLVGLGLVVRHVVSMDYVLCCLPDCLAATPEVYAVAGSALGLIVDNEAQKQHFFDTHLGPVPAIVFPDDLFSAVAVLRARPVLCNRPVPAVQTDPHDFPRDRIRILLVSYFAGPSPTVGAMRVNYWFDELDAISKGQTDTHLATAIRPVAPDPRVHYIPDTSNLDLCLASGWSEKAIAQCTRTERERRRYVNTLSYYWRLSLELYFGNMDTHFDCIIISGNPFVCFDFAAFAKRRWNSTIILDYRDPFANNPLMRYNDQTRETLRHIERGYAFQADCLTTVNPACIPLIELSGHVETHVIPNGFDERTIAGMAREIPPLRPLSFVYCGKIYAHGDLTPLLDAAEALDVRITHLGSSVGLSERCRSSPALIRLGAQTHAETLAVLATARCGIVYVSEFLFETPVKVYDYLGMGCDILVLAPGYTPAGPLWDLLRDVANVFWVKNERQEIAHFLQTYAPGSLQRTNLDRFSRRRSTQRLLDIILSRTGSPRRGERPGTLTEKPGPGERTKIVP